MKSEVCTIAAIMLPNGKIYTAARHHLCLQAMREDSISQFDIQHSIQGFMTNKQRFVTREEGYKLQIKAGIPSKNPEGYIKGELFSEDLY